MAVGYKSQLVEYFKKNLAKGYTEESLKIALKRQGYSILIIEQALESAHEEISKKAPVLREKPIIKHEVYVDDTPVVIEKKKKWWKGLFG